MDGSRYPEWKRHKESCVLGSGPKAVTSVGSRYGGESGWKDQCIQGPDAAQKPRVETTRLRAVLVYGESDGDVKAGGMTPVAGRSCDRHHSVAILSLSSISSSPETVGLRACYAGAE